MSADNATVSLLVEEFLGRVRIGDVPDIDRFIEERQPSEDPDELHALLATLLDLERLPLSTADGDDHHPLPDLSGSGYRLLKKIGAGGMGVVYEAEQTGLGRHVAVKLLRPELLADPEIQALFRLEAHILARFNHPGIVRILDAGQCGGIFFYAMELSEGQPLDTLTKRPDERLLLQWAAEAAEAVACAHCHGIVHGDLKPANLLLDKNGHVRICDFGLAFTAPPASNAGKRQNGTLRYMAPEAQRAGIRDFAGDQYSLCASLVEIAAAKPFVRGEDRSRLFRNQQFAAVLTKGLADEPKDRYPAVTDLREDLRRIVRHEPVAAGRTPRLVRIGLFCKRHPIYTVASTLTLFCLAAVLHGFVRTEAALKLAQRNAATANAAIGVVFDEMVQLPPAPENADLLARLIPYYEQIVSNPNIPPSELTGALSQLAQTAMRTGDYPLAERALRRLTAVCESSFNLCRLADTLFQQGKRDESNRLFRSVIDRYSEATLAERLDAAQAHLHFIETEPHDRRSDHQQAAWRILSGCLAEAPANDTALFLYAQLLRHCPETAAEPIPGLPEEPLEILDDLSTRHPNDSRCWLTFIDCATEWFQQAAPTDACPAEIDAALTKSDIILWRFLNRPHAVRSALALKLAAARWQRFAGARREPSRGQISIAILTQALLNQPNLSENDQSDLIALSLDALEHQPHAPRRLLPRAHNLVRRALSRDRQLESLSDFLRQHPLPRKDEFLRRIKALEAESVPLSP